MKTIFTTRVMTFPGFNESVLENSDMVDSNLKSFVKDLHDKHPKLKVNVDDDVEIDYKEYEKEISNVWVRSYASSMPSFVKSCEFDFLLPPQDHFSTDELYVKIELADNWLDHMKAFIAQNREWFEKRIADDWTPRKGFQPYIENNLDDWLKGLEDEVGSCVGLTLAYMIYRNNDEFEKEINKKVTETVSLYSFISLTPEKQEELDELVVQEEKERYIGEYEEKHQLQIDFS